jgi:hypothetical protein
VIGGDAPVMHSAIEVRNGRDNLVQGNLVTRGSTDAIVATDGAATLQGNVVAE